MSDLELLENICNPESYLHKTYFQNHHEYGLFGEPVIHSKPHSDPLILLAYLDALLGANDIDNCNILWRRSLIYDQNLYNIHLNDFMYPSTTEDSLFYSTKSINNILKIDTAQCNTDRNTINTLSEFLQPTHCVSVDYNLSSHPYPIEKFIKYFRPIGLLIGKPNNNTRGFIWASTNTYKCAILVRGPLSSVSSKTPGMSPLFVTEPSPCMILPKDKVEFDNIENSSSIKRAFLYIIISTICNTNEQELPQKRVIHIGTTDKYINHYLTSCAISFCISARSSNGVMNTYIEKMKTNAKRLPDKSGHPVEIASYKLGFFPSIDNIHFENKRGDCFIFSNFNVCLENKWNYKHALIKYIDLE